MSTYTLRLTCCCGGEMAYTGTHTPYLVAERAAFNHRHADCKPLPPVVQGARHYPIAGRR